jgi:hypothetical protein
MQLHIFLCDEVLLYFILPRVVIQSLNLNSNCIYGVNIEKV